MTKNRRGKFLVLEGIDGCGKSTQLRALAAWLPTSGLLPAGARLVTSREPGGTALGMALRGLLLHPRRAIFPKAAPNYCCMPLIGRSMCSNALNRL